jgi:outer membrane protein assembly factor BamB
MSTTESSSSSLPNQTQESTRSKPRQIRWWPAGVIVVLAMMAIVYVRFIREDSHQHRNIFTMEIGVATVILLWLWVLLGSRLAWKTRGLIAGAALGCVALMAGLFEIHGVTGDLVPILKFRWSKPTAEFNEAAANSSGAAKQAHKSGLPTAIPGTNDFPQFLGPHRNATVPQGPKLARDWTARPPEKIWRQPIGAGWSGFVIQGGRAITQEQRGEFELVVCYDLLTGQLVWKHSDTARYFTTIAGEGPRATPAIAEGRVFAAGATGILNCLDLDSGKVLWSKNILTENEAKLNDWGVAGSPLVLPDLGLVIVNPGGRKDRSLVAYRVADGSLAWAGGDDKASYSSPCEATLAGVRQVLMFNQHALFGHDAQSGAVLWRHEWHPGWPHVALPVPVDDRRLLVSSGYGVGGELLEITRDSSGKFAVEKIWKTNRLKSKFNNFIIREGFIYALDDGVLVCLEIETGDLKWKEGRYGHGQFLLVRDLLLITAENGDVVLLEPRSDANRELTRFEALSGKTWNPPALSGDLLLVRNDQEAACYRLPVQP